MFHVKNIEENIDFILTFLPNDFVNLYFQSRWLLQILRVMLINTSMFIA